jgi:hypothetical protein
VNLLPLIVVLGNVSTVAIKRTLRKRRTQSQEKNVIRAIFL